MPTARFNKITYQVRPTGKIRRIKAKHYDDHFNGYEDQYRPAESWKQLGLYDEQGALFATITRDGKFIYSGHQRLGCITIKPDP